MFEAIDIDHMANVVAPELVRERLWVSVIKARRAVVNDGPVQQVFM